MKKEGFAVVSVSGVHLKLRAREEFLKKGYCFEGRIICLEDGRKFYAEDIAAIAREFCAERGFPENAVIDGIIDAIALARYKEARKEMDLVAAA